MYQPVIALVQPAVDKRCLQVGVCGIASLRARLVLCLSTAKNLVFNKITKQNVSTTTYTVSQPLPDVTRLSIARGTKKGKQCAEELAKEHERRW